MHDPKRSAMDRPWSLRGYAVWQVNRPYKPPTDVVELPDKLIVMVEIAGMRANQIGVAMTDRELVISGVRERPAVNAVGWHQMEVGYGEFRVELTLPYPVERQAVSATYRDGFLHVELPRRADAQRYVIEVITEEQDADER
jgi:HSP20 family protein